MRVPAPSSKEARSAAWTCSCALCIGASHAHLRNRLAPYSGCTACLFLPGVMLDGHRGSTACALSSKL